jgi:hypothetical protein
MPTELAMWKVYRLGCMECLQTWLCGMSTEMSTDLAVWNVHRKVHRLGCVECLQKCLQKCLQTSLCGMSTEMSIDSVVWNVYRNVHRLCCVECPQKCLQKGTFCARNYRNEAADKKRSFRGTTPYLLNENRPTDCVCAQLRISAQPFSSCGQQGSRRR